MNRAFTSTASLPQANSFPTHLLSPRDETDKGQAGKKKGVALRLGNGSDGNDLPCIVDALGYLQNHSSGQIDQRIEIHHAFSVGAGHESMLRTSRAEDRPAHHLPSVVDAQG